VSIRRIRALAKKEFIQIRRDVRSLVAAVFLPLLMIFLFGYALSLDVDRIPTVVLDRDGTPEARRFVSLLADSRYFEVTRYLERPAQLDEALARGLALMAVVIPQDFGRALRTGAQTPVQVLFDATDSNTTTIAEGYIKAVATDFGMALQAGRLRRAGLRMADIPVEPRIRVWFNPEMKSRNFIIPGLTGVIMMSICALLTAMTISREKETGTLEQLISTPVTRGEMILGKLLPYLGVGLVDLTLVVGAGVLVFGVPFRGSYLNLFFTSLLFLAGTLAWGLFLSAVAKTQLQASQMAMLSAYLPSFLLSGFIYPIENMPVVLRAITHVVPARYFVEILKGLFLRGVGLDCLWPQVLALLVYTAVVFTLAVRKFTLRLL